MLKTPLLSFFTFSHFSHIFFYFFFSSTKLLLPFIKHSKKLHHIFRSLNFISTHKKKMANNPKNKGMYVKRPFCPSTPTTTSTVYNLTNHFSRLQHQQPPNTKSPKYPSSDALSHKVVSQQGKRVVLESGKEGEKPQEEEDGKKVVGLVVVKGVERSRSFNGDSKVELSKFLMNNSAKLMAADMPPLIQIHAVGFARKIKDSLEKFTSKTLAFSLKKEFDGIYGPAWHCIVGSSFGSFVTHSSGGFLYFSLDQKLYILLFKTAVQRAD